MSSEGRQRDVRLGGLVFCQPHSKFAKDEILPALRYFDCRSGQHVNFYFPGYAKGWEAPAGDVMALAPTDGPGWIFNAQSFNEFRDTLQKQINWQYSGGSELILANARYDSERKVAWLDFSSALCITFERLKHDGALSDVEILFERIFQYAEKCDGIDPTWGFSDQEGKTSIGHAFKNLVFRSYQHLFDRKPRVLFIL
jgi:hypothetical protein